MLRRVLLLVLATVLVAASALGQLPPVGQDWCAELYTAIASGDSEWAWTHRLGTFEVAALECGRAALDVAAAAAAASGSYRSFILAGWAATIVGGEAGRQELARLELLAESWEVREYGHLPDFTRYRILASDTGAPAVETLGSMCLCERSNRAQDAILQLTVINSSEARNALRRCAESPVEDEHDHPAREQARKALERQQPQPEVIWGDGTTSPRRELIAAIFRVGLPNLERDRDWVSPDDHMRFRFVDQSWLAVPEGHAVVHSVEQEGVEHLAFDAHVRADDTASIVAVTAGSRGYEVVLHRSAGRWQVVIVHPTWQS